MSTIVFVVIFPSTLAYLFFNRGIELIGPNRAAPFFHLVPVFGSVMAIVFLGEKPELFHLIGYIMVIAGIVIASRRKSPRPPPVKLHGDNNTSSFDAPQRALKPLAIHSDFAQSYARTEWHRSFASANDR